MTNESSTHDNGVVKKIAIASRLLVLTLIIFWRNLVTPYDTSASINPGCLSSPNNQSDSVKFPYIASLIEDSIVWDGVYYVRTAQCGYEYEQSYAFWPLLPLCIFALSKSVFAPLVPLVGYRAVLGLSGYVVNYMAFVFAATYFHRLSVIVLKDKVAAMRASILFCFNPASIFFSSIYSESLYALLSIGGLYHLMSGAKNLSTLWLALSVLARSNGVLNAGYIGFQTMHQAYDAAYYKKRVYMNKGLGARPEFLWCTILFKVITEDQTLRRRRRTMRENDLVELPSESCSLDKEEYLTLTLLPFVLHLGFMAGVAFLVMHVQVATRFLSANPPIYWFAASLPALSEYGKRWGYLIWAYCAAYILLGTLLFSNFYPFT